MTMLRTSPWHIVNTLIITVMLGAGCPPPEDDDDDTGPSSVDAAVVDSGIAVDGAVSVDASAGSDGGSGSDASVGSDGGSGSDASVGSDGGSGSDASAVADAGTTGDAAVAVDASPRTDAGGTVDGSTTDAGAEPADAGVEPADAGIGSDGGQPANLDYALQRFIPFAGAGFDSVDGMTMDSAGNVYVAGKFKGSIDFNWTDGTDTHTAETSGIFLSRINHDGTYGWTRTLNVGGQDTFKAITVDGAGHIVLMGDFYGAVDFDPAGGESLTADANGDVFLTWYSAAGEYQHTRALAGTRAVKAFDMTTDDDGNLYVAGTFSGTVDFDWSPTGTDSKAAQGFENGFVTRWNADDTYGWTLTTEGAVLGIAVDHQRNVVLAGSFYFSADLDPSPTAEDPYTSAGSGDGFITKVMNNGSYGWTRVIAGADYDEARHVVVDQDNNIYVAGILSQDVTLDWDGGGSAYTAAGVQDAYLLRANADGSFGWGVAFGGDQEFPFDDLPGGLVLDDADRLLLGGTFAGITDFPGAGGPARHEAQGLNDAYLHACTLEGAPLGTWILAGDDLDEVSAILARGNQVVLGMDSYSVSLDVDPGAEVTTYQKQGEQDGLVVTLIRQ